ncbi:hypothetical protein AZE42_10816, partial [Rhizopogon vesiculosus]
VKEIGLHTGCGSIAQGREAIAQANPN